jgi:hypothetical protein
MITTKHAVVLELGHHFSFRSGCLYALRPPLHVPLWFEDDSPQLNYSEIHKGGPLFSKLADKCLDSGWRGNYAGLFSHKKIFVVIKN